MGDGKDEPTSSDGRPPWIVDNWSGIRGVALVPLDSSLPVSTHQDFGSNKTKSSERHRKRQEHGKAEQQTSTIYHGGRGV
eukprot:CAMPEP_0178769502 /NCGR_PEP_ID=MMETSP0744-20121128/20864_1 /TAXON_ID=913974 /ORGANISM="Nitzschia punctata, Strain CCMP561" /LENGTH=79 /DNA_ID=CAMNT_0020425759 /DNA_START=390 /DNA_END=629 /DNA_ORIENTATION=-